MSLMERNDSLTSDEKALRATRARRRFKAAIRIVIEYLPWLSRNIEKSTRPKREHPQILLEEKTIELKLRQKCLLLKPIEHRTENQKNQLKRLIGNLKCFQKYPSNVKPEFTASMYFCYYGSNRILVKQDREAEKLYVLISGEIRITQTEWDPILKENVTNDLGIFTSGYIFGETDLLHETPRSFTVTTQTGCEFIYLKRDDFHKIINDNVKSLWDEVQLNMSWFEYFDNWSTNDILDCCILAQKKKYESDQIVLSDNIGNHDNIYFITKGFCYMVEQIDFNNRNNTTYQSNNRIRFVKIARFNQLACFNLGEDLKNRLIIAGSETECLLLPRYFLFAKALRTFKSIQQFLEITIPKHQEVMKKYLETDKYRKFKIRSIENNLRHQSVVNFIHNVPYSIRLVDDVNFL